MVKAHRTNSVFIAGTDTDVGKTFIAGLLLDYLKRNDVQVGYQKWVATGNIDVPADLEFCQKLAELALDREMLDLQVPYRFAFAASPHLAAEREGVNIDPERILGCFDELAQRHELLLVEGVGGVLVPLRRNLLCIDLLGQVQIPVLLVARSGLGTLNHTLLSLEALRSRDIPVLGVVFTDTGQGGNEEIIRDNLKTIEALGAVDVFGRLAWCATTQEAVSVFEPLGNAIFQAIRQHEKISLAAR